MAAFTKKQHTLGRLDRFPAGDQKPLDPGLPQALQVCRAEGYEAGRRATVSAGSG
jgi:hypothetical protein